MFKAKKKSTRTRFEICSKLTIKTPNNTNFVVLVYLLLTLKLFYLTPCSMLTFYVNFEQVNTGWHLLSSLPYLQKQSPRGVYQERCSSFSQFTGEHPCGSVSSTLLKLHFCMGILLKI